MAKRPIKIILKYSGQALPVQLSHSEPDDRKLYMKIDRFSALISVAQSKVGFEVVCEKSNLWVTLSIAKLRKLITWTFELQIGRAACHNSFL